jgi:hypothetical protein
MDLAAELVFKNINSGKDETEMYIETVNKFACADREIMLPFLGLQAMMSSQIIGSLTAVEVLLGDLWVAAVNYGPKVLAENAVKANKKNAAGLKLERSDTTKAQEKTIPVSCLSEYGYDLRERMGDLLLEEKKVDFESVYNAAVAYCLTFGDWIAPLFDENTASFADIHALSLVRNVLVHNGGNVDADFVEGIAKKPATSFQSLRALDVTHKLPIHGGLSGKMMSCASVFGVNLISAVDKYLSNNMVQNGNN